MPKLKLFYWTYAERDCCDHKFVFAESRNEARRIVAKDIRRFWKPAKDERNPRLLALNKENCAREIKEINGPWGPDEYPRWELSVIDIKPGIV